jgi:thiamine transport system permease protein
MFQKLYSWILVSFLLSPFFILLYLSPGKFSIDAAETWWAFKNSAWQALFSGLLCLLLGTVSALGLLWSQQRKIPIHATLIGLCLLPQFLPVVITLLGLMNGLQPFPMGLVGIIICHAFSYFGMTAVLILNQINEVLPRYAEVAQISGANKFLFWRKIGFPLIRKDLLLIYIYLVAIFFSSFSIPLVVGGGRGTTLEVLIYEKMRLSTDWSPAIMLSFIQSGVLLLLSLISLKSRASYSSGNRPPHYYGSIWGVLPLALIMAGFFTGFFSGLISGIEQIKSLEMYQEDLIYVSFNSLALALITYLFLRTFMYLFCWLVEVPPLLNTFLNGYIAPSVALTAFGFLVLLPMEPGWSYFKIPLVFLLLSFGAVYRLGWGERLNSLKSQVQVAWTLGASRSQILNQVVWPQMKSQTHWMAGLVATWACGDFAVSRILSTRDFTLPLVLESLLTSYRMGIASLLSLLLVVLCLICFLIVVGLDYVNRRKSESF